MPKPMGDEQVLRMLHHVTLLPVCLYQSEAPTFALPGTIPSVARLLRGEDTLPEIQVSPGQPYTPQYVSSPYAERFLYFELGADRSILFGPFLATPPDGQEAYRLIRRLRLPISWRLSLQSYFDGLPVADATRHFYLGRLLMTLYTAQQIVPHVPQAAYEGRIGHAFFQRTHENRTEQFYHPPFFLEQELTRFITLGDRTGAVRALSEINVLSRATLASTPLRSLKNSLICSCTLFARAAIAAGVSSPRAFALSDAYIQSMEDMHDLQVLEDLEEEMVLSYIDLVEDRLGQRYSSVTRTAIRYIDEHLTEKLTLKHVAGAVFVHPSYLSSRFHTDIGETLSCFIQKRKIEDAKHFLRHTRTPVSEIADFYHFSSQSHFIQIFKKHTGQTPQAYRKAMVE